MEPSVPEPSPVIVSVSCHPDCRYAEPLRDDYTDWVWCTRPGVDVRIRPLGGDCRRIVGLDAAREPRDAG